MDAENTVEAAVVAVQFDTRVMTVRQMARLQDLLCDFAEHFSDAAYELTIRGEDERAADYRAAATALEAAVGALDDHIDDIAFAGEAEA